MARCLVTGANRGIGLELCKQLAARGDEVLAVCRKSSRALEALGVRVEQGVDVTDRAATKALVERLAGPHFDLVVQNAGIYEEDELGKLDFDAIRRQFEVNAVAPLAFTEALLRNLLKGSKIALMSSLMGSMGDNGSGGSYGYRMSKAALNAAGVSLARDLASRGIAVAILHPGLVNTDMTGHRGIDPAQSVRGLLRIIDSVHLENSGRFWDAEDGAELPW